MKCGSATFSGTLLLSANRSNLVMKQVEEEVTKKYVKSEACKQREKEILVG
jgi:hypothetical protein